jgi:hypothetical protein
MLSTLNYKYIKYLYFLANSFFTRKLNEWIKLINTDDTSYRFPIEIMVIEIMIQLNNKTCSKYYINVDNILKK